MSETSNRMMTADARLAAANKIIAEQVCAIARAHQIAFQIMCATGEVHTLKFANQIVKLLEGAPPDPPQLAKR